MATFILTWNPDRWDWPVDDYEQAIRATESGEVQPGRWSVGGRRGGISIGDTAYLLRQGRDQGIVASGTFASEVWSGTHWDGSGGGTTYAAVLWDTVLNIDDRLKIEELQDRIPNGKLKNRQRSGTELRAPADAALTDLWLEHTRCRACRSPEELPPGTLYPEGSITRAEVNRYERDPRARSACLAHHGTRCAVCDLRFEERYGEIGTGFIHVHHIRELATVGPDYSVDPIEDLRPVCPNCHAMLHRRRPASTIEEIRGALSPGGT